MNPIFQRHRSGARLQLGHGRESPVRGDGEIEEEIPDAEVPDLFAFSRDSDELAPEIHRAGVVDEQTGLGNRERSQPRTGDDHDVFGDRDGVSTE